MGNCKDCNHWDSDNNGFDPKRRPFPFEEGWGVCELSEGWEGQKIEDKTTLMYARDFDQYQAWLMTEASFGCVLFEKE